MFRVLLIRNSVLDILIFRPKDFAASTNLFVISCISWRLFETSVEAILVLFICTVVLSMRINCSVGLMCQTKRTAVTFLQIVHSNREVPLPIFARSPSSLVYYMDLYNRIHWPRSSYLVGVKPSYYSILSDDSLSSFSSSSFGAFVTFLTVLFLFLDFWIVCL